MPEYDTPPNIVYPQGGGLNQGIPPSEIDDAELVQCQNFYPFGRKIIRRGGVRRVSSTAYSETLTSFFPYKMSTGDWVLIVGGTSSFGKLSGTGFLVIPTATGLVIISVTLPWVFAQYNDVVYAARQGQGSLLRVTPDVVIQAGITAPAAAPTIAQGAAGALAAGDYAAVVTYANSLTGVESNPSPKSNVLSLASLKKIDYSAIPISLNPQVDSRKIYRTLINQVNEYFYVATIPNNIATTYTGDEVLPQDMGDAALFTNFTPPPNLRWIATHVNRMFGTDGTDVFYTNLFNMEGWTDDQIEVFRDDGHEIRVLYSFGDRLIIGKTNKVHFLTGTDRSTFQLLTLSDRHGCMSGHSMRSAEGLLFWFGSGKNFYRSDGNNTVGIADIKIRDILAAIPDSVQHLVTAEVNPQLSQYIASVPQDPYSTNRAVVVYNYRNDAWAVYTHPDQAPSYLAEFFDTNYGRSLYGVQGDGHIYDLYRKGQGTDYGNAINAKLLTRRERGGTLLAKAMRRVHVLVSTAAEQVTLKAYRDGRTVPSATRTMSLNVDDAWKVANLSTLRDPGSVVQLGVEYTGTTEIELEALGVDLEMIDRYAIQPQ